MASELTIIEIGDRVLSLDISNFGDDNIPVEQYLLVQREDIMEDMITFPVILNRIANLKADIDDLVRQESFDLTLLYAQLYEEHRKKMLVDGDKPTEKGLENAIIRDPKYIAKKRFYFTVQKNADIIDGWYWSAKSKDKKLDAISAKVKPEEFEKEILTDSINSVMIKSHKSNFPNKR